MRQNNWWSIFLIFGMFLLWMELGNLLFPPKKVEKGDLVKNEAVSDPSGAKDNQDKGLSKSGQKAGPSPGASLAKSFAPWKPENWVILGSGKKDSDFHIEAKLDPQGACVRSLVLNKFQKADLNGVLVRDESGEPATLDLIPQDEITRAGSFLLYHYSGDSLGEYPLDTLGKATWEIVAGPGGKPIQEVTREDGAKGVWVTFRSSIRDIRVEKIFSLYEGEYHLGLEIKVSRESLPGDGKAVPFRYQLTGGRGLPIEGAWYTTIFKNSMIGHEDRKGNFDRDYQDGRALSNALGGYEVDAPDRFIRYAAVAVQYFTSAIAIDDRQKEDAFIIRRARPTVEVALFKGVLIDKPEGQLVVRGTDGRAQIFWVAPTEAARKAAAELVPQSQVALRYIWESNPEPGSFRYVAVDFQNPDQTNALFQDDVTIRVSSAPMELKPGQTANHRYILYHGPAKPSQIQYARGEHKVDPNLISRYSETLKLGTIVDYPSAVGRWFFGFSWVVIFFTNLIHKVLALMSFVIPSLGLCIIILTVMVRGIMFPMSRKQAIMSLKMQQLAPELKEMQAKLKGDQQAMARAQMELYRKYNINPVGSCWVILLQMPIFMGLYFALQESIRFRLEPFWPTWIHNLAAPDAMFSWGDGIPMISRPADYGSYLYFGPSFNLLPLFAMAFMVLQQKWFMPPPTTEEQEMQQKMTMIMTMVMGLMFYRVAAGMCLYFIASSLWSLSERKLLLPKKLPMGAQGSNGSVEVLSPQKAAPKEEYSRRKVRTVKDQAAPTGFAAKIQAIKDWYADIQKRASK